MLVPTHSRNEHLHMSTWAPLLHQLRTLAAETISDADERSRLVASVDGACAFLQQELLAQQNSRVQQDSGPLVAALQDGQALLRGALSGQPVTLNRDQLRGHQQSRYNQQLLRLKLPVQKRLDLDLVARPTI